MARGVIYLGAEQGRVGAGWYICMGEIVVVGPNRDEVGNFVPFATREAAQAWADGGAMSFLQPIGAAGPDLLH